MWVCQAVSSEYSWGGAVFGRKISISFVDIDGRAWSNAVPRLKQRARLEHKMEIEMKSGLDDGSGGEYTNRHSKGR